MSDDHLLPPPDTADWRAHANCRGVDPNVFYPGDVDYSAARKICNDCPVQEQCLRAAMAEETGHGRQGRYGMRGGLTPDERHRLPWRICKRCDKAFPARTPRTMTCSPECYEANRREAVARHNAKISEEREALAALDDVDCWCGFTARTPVGLQHHQRLAHGRVAA